MSYLFGETLILGKPHDPPSGVVMATCKQCLYVIKVLTSFLIEMLLEKLQIDYGFRREPGAFASCGILCSVVLYQVNDDAMRKCYSLNFSQNAHLSEFHNEDRDDTKDP